MWVVRSFKGLSVTCLNLKRCLLEVCNTYRTVWIRGPISTSTFETMSANANPDLSTMGAAAANPLQSVPAMNATVHVEVYDEQGELMGRVKVGDTKTQAIQRVGGDSVNGVLLDKDIVGLLPTDLIILERGPYTYKKSLQPQKSKLRCCFVYIFVFNLLLRIRNGRSVE
jgi:hypothetical protein